MKRYTGERLCDLIEHPETKDMKPSRKLVDDLRTQALILRGAAALRDGREHLTKGFVKWSKLMDRSADAIDATKNKEARK